MFWPEASRSATAPTASREKRGSMCRGGSTRSGRRSTTFLLRRGRVVTISIARGLG